MALYAGPRWREGEPVVGWVRDKDGRVVDEGQGRPPGAATPAVLLDGLYDYHTHMGDAFLAGERIPRRLERAVAPDVGLKHRRLATAAPSAVIAGMRAHLEALARNGVEEILDFREQGVEGLGLAREAARGARVPRIRLLGRPRNGPGDGPELDEVVSAADGIGAPSLNDWGFEACARLVRAAHRAGRPYAMHWSEARRESAEEALSLRPDFLVHACHATRADRRRLQQSDVPLVLCPTSNAFFGLPTPASDMEAAGVRWFLGTDNAMLGSVDLLAEARALRRKNPRVPSESILRALTTPPAKAINRFHARTRRVGPPSRLAVLARRRDGDVAWDRRAKILER